MKDVQTLGVVIATVKRQMRRCAAKAPAKSVQSSLAGCSLLTLDATSGCAILAFPSSSGAFCPVQVRHQQPGCRDTALSSMRGRVYCVLCRVVGRVDGLEPINSDSSLDFERYERGRNAKGEESYNTRRPRVSANTASLIRQRNLEASADTLSPVRQSRSSARKEVLVTFEKKGARRRLRMGS